MKSYNPIDTQRLIQSKDLPSASPVITCHLEEEEIETRIASNLQTLIRIGKPEIKQQYDERRESLRQIIVECCKELDEMREVKDA